MQDVILVVNIIQLYERINVNIYLTKTTEKQVASYNAVVLIPILLLGAYSVCFVCDHYF